ncbi:ABC transporter related [Candidatus Moduliflexus flocculans]|uniref:ABC transporter related n=1 Tax=Candidatus Moduliflexus flocculans TaxID=1499966 RepID=A0A0S6VWH7_9BACT|nr:ABC transporter related [Candidatus Moduliflexus flocculans]
MGNIAISVENLGKCYRIGQAQKRPENFRAAVRSFVTSPFEYLRSRLREPSADELFWALKDVSFDVKHGEVLGVIGRNGAGKSTLLKILSRITEPTTGRAKVYGRVGSLLEVGTGFHPELTGRENIYLNGTILGMKRAEIDKKFDEIVEFSGVEKFLDTPVKRYSSGMYVRLAFAVAAHLEPEILLVDEVLAVGDVEFQKKCLGKMGDVARKGRTVFFVSHNMTAIQSLCHRCIWLNEGGIADEGASGRIVGQYLQAFSTVTREQIWEHPEQAPGDDNIRIHRIAVSAEDDLDHARITVETPIKIQLEFWNFLQNALLSVSLHLFTLENTYVFDSPSPQKQCPTGLMRAACHIPRDLLNDGVYRVEIMILQNTSVRVFFHENLATFEVHDVERAIQWYGKWSGVIRPKLSWTLE